MISAASTLEDVIQEVAVARPLTHDLLRSVIDTLGAQVPAAAFGQRLQGGPVALSFNQDDSKRVVVGGGVKHRWR